MKIQEGFMDFKGFKTYYRIVNPNGKKIPLILLHGGPGSTHNYFEVLDDLAFQDDRPLIMYDQIGCGKSFIEGHKELFNASTWMDELEALRKELNLNPVHMMGTSWGGMLEIYYAIKRKPKGVKSYTLSSSLSSAKLWKEEQYRRIKYMPEKMQNAIYKADRTGNYEDEDYLIALDEFMRIHCFDDKKYPELEYLNKNKVVGVEAYETGWGKNEFSPTGTLSDYEFTDRLVEIETPCLIINGQKDLSSPYISKIMYDNIKNSKWELFQYSGHMPFLEETEKYIKILKDWLNTND